MKNSQLKAKASTTSVTLDSYDPYSMAYVSFEIPGFDSSDIKAVTIKGESQNYELVKVYGNKYVIRFKGNVVSEKPKKESLTFNIYASGNSFDGAPNGTVKVAVSAK